MKKLHFLALLSCAIFPGLVKAQDLPQQTISVPVETAGVKTFSAPLDDTPIRLTPDKSEIIRLETRASSIIIGNPAHLSIIADTADTLVLVPRSPGATHFYVLDEDSTVIMAKHVIVASPKEQYIRVRNTCENSESDSCQSTQVYYCPDMCHEIAPQATEAASTEDSAAAGAAESAADMADGETPEDGDMMDQQADER